jgi:hypothetical protein
MKKSDMGMKSLKVIKTEEEVNIDFQKQLYNIMENKILGRHKK